MNDRTKTDPGLVVQQTIDWDKSVVDWDYWSKVPRLTAEEFCILLHRHDPRNFETDRDFIPGCSGRTLGELVSDKSRIINRSMESIKEKSTTEWIKWAKHQNWDIPAYLLSILDLPAPAPRPQGHLNHNSDWQQRANEIAAKEFGKINRSPTRKKVSQLLAQELGVDPATVERRIRKCWR